jgi:molybdopterin/thiamine biosynthesis adenylyltransferase
VSADALVEYIKKVADDRGLLPLSAYKEIAAEFSISFKDIERVVLERGLFPLRFQRQRNLLGSACQLRLLNAKVAIVGCGGLGGSIFEMLLRLGVGHLLVIDPDFFCESNLNRQLLATTENLGRYKVDAAFERAQQVNPVTEIETLNQVFQSASGETRLTSCDLVFDSLDSVSDRLELAQLCARNNLMLIHGAVAGWCGQMAPVVPGSERMAQIYPETYPENFPENSDSSLPAAEIEALVDNIAPTVNTVAALQVAAAIKYLCDFSSASEPHFRSGGELTGCFIDLTEPDLERLR